MTNYPAARPLLSFSPLLLCLPAAVWVLAAAAGDPPAHQPSGCKSSCGGVDIPYPFGVGDQCAINGGFNLTCSLVNGTERLFSGPFEVTKISVADAKAWLKMNISWWCYDDGTRQMKQATWGGNFTKSAFRFSHEDNKIFVIGCNTLAYITTEYHRLLV